jgi:hypothetical protein
VSDVRDRGKLGELVSEVRWLTSVAVQLDIGKGSSSTYASSWKFFLEFCDIFSVDPARLSEAELCLCITYFATRRTTSSIDSFVSAIQHIWNTEGFGPLPRGTRYLRAKKGLRRIFGTSDVVVRTRSVSVVEVKRIVDALDPSVLADVCFALEIIIAFFLCLRTEDHVAGRLLWGDVYGQSDGSVEFVLPPGKSVRSFRHVAVAAREDSLDVLLWLERYAALLPEAQRAHSQPLFVSLVSSPGGDQHFWCVSRHTFITRFKSEVRRVLGFDPSLYAGYSLRRGGVTEMLSRLCPLPMVKRHVGWTANSTAVYDYYDHHAKAQLLAPTAYMG